MASKLYAWLDSRLKLKPVKDTLLDEPIPGGASWIYVFGSATLFLFALQAITGMFLAVYYAPTPDHAYDSVRYIETQVLFGAFVRGLHHWGASAMVVVIGLHMLQVFLYGAYKPPREAMWIVGVLLLLLTMGFAFTGYLLPWDQNAYWATQVGINMAGGVPFVGTFLVKVMRGGEMLGALTLSRFFAVHVLFLPATIAVLVALHMFILRRVGPAGPWSGGLDRRGKRPESSPAPPRPEGQPSPPSGERRARRSEPFYPRQVFMDAVVMLGVFAVVAVLALTVAFPLADKANPSDHSFIPVPEWYFLFYYQFLKYMEGPILGPIATWVIPGGFIALLLALPFLDPSKDRAPSSRRTVLGLGALFLVGVFALVGLSLHDLQEMKRTDPAVASGKALYDQFGCIGCHRVHAAGGSVGPDLSYVGDHRDRDWLIKHFRDPQSTSPGSIMPKFPLDERQLTDLTAYMLSLKKGA
ncbi:MAG: cytochrome b N-terminal domain-containing protein [Nitrospirales bacterium]|nr:cytochrome b N-terminal domain-containing protein [Nitrospirales bacterium]